MLTVPRVAHRRTRRGDYAMIVREHYLRDDISCGHGSCHQCRATDTAVSSLRPQPIVIPDAHTLALFSEVFVDCGKH